MKMRNLIVKVLCIVGVVVVIASCIGVTIATTFNDHTYTATVTDKDRIVKGEEGEDSYYIVFAKDDEGNYYEFKNEDNLFRGKFNSSSFQNQIEVGETYEFTVVGYRIPFFSAYENIIKFEKVN